MRVAPDDEVYRVNTVRLGPKGLTFPWTARYLAYAVWLITFLVVIGFEAVTPLSVGVPPTWEVVITTLFTYAVMGLVDHERPVSAVWQTFVADLSAPRSASSRTVVTSTRKVRIRPSRHGELQRSGSGRRVRVPRRVG
jgi:hypothetical protein